MIQKISGPVYSNMNLEEGVRQDVTHAWDFGVADTNEGRYSFAPRPWLLVWPDRCFTCSVYTRPNWFRRFWQRALCGFTYEANTQ